MSSSPRLSMSSRVVADWKYDYGVSDRDCSAMLLWMLIKLNPDAKIDAGLLER